MRRQRRREGQCEGDHAGPAWQHRSSCQLACGLLPQGLQHAGRAGRADRQAVSVVQTTQFMTCNAMEMNLAVHFSRGLRRAAPGSGVSCPRSRFTGTTACRSRNSGPTGTAGYRVVCQTLLGPCSCSGVVGMWSGGLSAATFDFQDAAPAAGQSKRLPAACPHLANELGSTGSAWA